MKRLLMEDYVTTKEAFEWRLPDTFNFGGEVVDYWAEDKDRLALIWLNDKGEEKRFTFDDIKKRSNQLANLLTERGIGKGDRVIVMLPRLPEWQIATVACHKVGAVPIPCVTMLTEKDLSYRADHSGARAVITTADNTHKFGDTFAAQISVGEAPGWIDFAQGCDSFSEEFVPVKMAACDPAVLYYTSGSTGMPKGVLHAARGLFVWRVSAWYWLTLTQNDLMWCTADTGWSKAGTSILYGPWSCGSAVLFYDGAFDPRMRINLLEKYRVSVFCGAATELRQLAELDFEELDLSSLRLTVSAGEAVNPEIVRSWKEKTGSDLLDGYGQTETLMTIVNYPCMPVKPGSMGKPLPGTEAAILDEDGNLLGPEEVGRLVIDADNPQIMLEYSGDPEKTAANYLMADGKRWYVTGDTARMDADGYIFYEGRDDDVINSSGYRIGPVEVESVVMEHDAVLECAAVASPDPTRGETVKAFIVLKEGVTGDEKLAKELQDFTKSQTAPYKYPRKIEFVTSLPKTVTGKIQRRILKAREFGNE
ncbi:acetyl-coenzyme A synthetase [Rhodobiaceae bacterium]|nr:acetyl-coenzyme A synthetase [Rhodobiaceae bacterium]